MFPSIIRAIFVACGLLGIGASAALAQDSPIRGPSPFPQTARYSCENQCWFQYTQCQSSSPYTDCTVPYYSCVNWCRNRSTVERPLTPPSLRVLRDQPEP
jgi:hypothetical protein